MSSSMLKGKTKSDLIEIAHLSGLLTKTQTNRMTKAQILEVLEHAEKNSINQNNPEGVQTDESEKQDPESKAETPKKKATSKKAEAAEDKPKAEEKKTVTAEKKETEPKTTKSTTKKTTTEKAKSSKRQTAKSTSSKKTTDTKTKNSQPTNEIDVEDQTTQDQETEKIKEKSSSQKEKTIKKRTKSSKKQGEASSDQVQETEAKTITEDAETSQEDNTKNSKIRKSKATEKKIIEIKANADSEGKIEAEQKKVEHAEGSAEKTENKPKEELEIVKGILEIMPDNYGFLRVENYLQSNHDVYIPPQFIRRFTLRNGDEVEGPAKVQRDSDRYRALTYINKVNGMTPDKMLKRPNFDRLTPIYPNEKYKLETQPKELATRMIDLISPIGKGQRGMIVSPPKAGKTILLQKVANAISINNPDSKLFVLLIDERPEEVTDMQRSIKGEVVYSTFDKTPENHVKVTELVLERAMRLVELGYDVVILLDSITRMSRAYNLTINPTGRTLSGGLDPGALHGPKRFFGAARNIENGGSLTIIATALVETGSRMDEVIFEEFKGTGNMEVCLDRKLAEKRVFPAIDLNRSSTRREELLMTKEELNTVWAMRKAFANSESVAVTETMINLLLKTKTNAQFANSISVSLKDQDLFEAMRGSISPLASQKNNTPANNGIR